MTDSKKKSNALWPDVSTIKGARSAAMFGFWAATFTAAVTALVAAWALGSGKAALGFIDASAFLDALLFAAVAFGIYKESRFAAIAGLLLFIAEKIYQIAATGAFRGAYIAFALLFCYVISIRGTFALRKLRSHESAG